MNKFSSMTIPKIGQKNYVKKIIPPLISINPATDLSQIPARVAHYPPNLVNSTLDTSISPSNFVPSPRLPPKLTEPIIPIIPITPITPKFKVPLTPMIPMIPMTPKFQAPLTPKFISSVPRTPSIPYTPRSSIPYTPRSSIPTTPRSSMPSTPRSSTMDSRGNVISEDKSKMLNPNTNKWINIGGNTYKKLVADGDIMPVEFIQTPATPITIPSRMCIQPSGQSRTPTIPLSLTHSPPLKLNTQPAQVPAQTAQTAQTPASLARAFHLHQMPIHQTVQKHEVDIAQTPKAQASRMRNSMKYPTAPGTCGVMKVRDHDIMEARKTEPYKRSAVMIPNLNGLCDDNPWYRKSEYSSDIKIAAITPIGTIARVPTCNTDNGSRFKRIPSTDRSVMTLDIIDEVDPLMSTAIYLNADKESGYNKVSEQMRKITAGIKSLQVKGSTKILALPIAQGYVPHSVFEEMLLIYENNQVYYMDRIDDGICIDEIKAGLTSLEHWFSCIIEPRPNNTSQYLEDDIAEWKARESYKITHRISSNCDKDLHQYIQPLPEQLLLLIKKYHSKFL